MGRPKGFVLSKESKQKISEGLKGHVVSQETKDKIGNRVVSDITKNKLRESTYLHYRGEDWANDLERERLERIERISVKGKNGHIGIKLSKKARKNISKGLKEYFRNGGTNSHKAGRGKGGFRKDIEHRVRSTWEVNVSRIWQAQGYLINEHYFYEPKCFIIGRTTYTPDFYFAPDNVYYEVKAYDTDEAKEKRIITRKRYGIKIVVIRKYTYLRLKNEYSSMIDYWE